MSTSTHTLISAVYGPTVSITEMKSELLVTSTLTQRFDCLRSMVSRSCFAAAFEKFSARWAYVCRVKLADIMMAGVEKILRIVILSFGVRFDKLD